MHLLHFLQWLQLQSRRPGFEPRRGQVCSGLAAQTIKKPLVFDRFSSSKPIKNQWKFQGFIKFTKVPEKHCQIIGFLRGRPCERASPNLIKTKVFAWFSCISRRIHESKFERSSREIDISPGRGTQLQKICRPGSQNFAMKMKPRGILIFPRT